MKNGGCSCGMLLSLPEVTLLTPADCTWYRTPHVSQSKQAVHKAGWPKAYS